MRYVRRHRFGVIFAGMSLVIGSGSVFGALVDCPNGHCPNTAGLTQRQHSKDRSGRGIAVRPASRRCSPAIVAQWRARFQCLFDDLRPRRPPSLLRMAANMTLCTEGCQPGPCAGQNIVVIESERLWQFVERMPLDGGGIIAGFRLHRRSIHTREEGDRHGPTAGIAAGVAKCAELFELDAGDAGFLVQFTAGGVGERFIFIQESTGQRPVTGERILFALNEQHVGPRIAGENDDVGGDARPRKFVHIFAAQDCSWLPV